MKDELGDRIKTNYEDRTRYFLPRRSYTIIRIDGKAFGSFTKGLKRPFDDDLMFDMDQTAIALCSKIQGAKFAFVQSDEITILLTDFETIKTSAWFDNNLQKISSVSASIATSAFNKGRLKRYLDAGIDFNKMKFAEFDSRVFQVPQKIEVFNTVLWRQQDTTRNSIQSVAQSLYSQKELHGKSSDKLQELIFQKGINWNDYSPKYKRGRIIIKESFLKEGAERSRWVMVEPPIFTQDKDFLMNLIPNNY